MVVTNVLKIEKEWGSYERSKFLKSLKTDEIFCWEPTPLLTFGKLKIEALELGIVLKYIGDNQMQVVSIS